MKNIFTKSIQILLIVGLISGIPSCKKSYLEPQPLSFFSPENAYIDAAGMRAALVACARNARIEYYGDNPPILTEMVFSEVTVEGTTDKSGPAQDLNLLITPMLQHNTITQIAPGFNTIGEKGIKELSMQTR